MVNPPPRKSRRDCFLGLHIDLHPGDKDTCLGLHVSEAMVRKLIRSARPDYIQYDCKGHVGFLGYPDSKVSRVAGIENGKGIIHDSLAIYRKVTAAMGVSLFMHFSGVWDNVACQDHPEWSYGPRDGSDKSKEGRTSTFGPYVTERMIPQMKEVIRRYDVDGFWVDGDAWATQIDYCDEALKRFRAAIGADESVLPPEKPGELHWVEWLTVQREQFFRYLRTYMDAIHGFKVQGPPVQVASNWLYTPIAPEPVKLPVDFISGDYSALDSVNSARFNARYMASVGLPWDLMAWAFAWFPGTRGHVTKPDVQLMQEAAAVMALGGGFQMYFHPDRHGGLPESFIAQLGRIADFCLPRRESCFQSEPVPQVAVLLDTPSLHARTANVYAPWAGEYSALQGALHAALEAGHSVDVLADHHLPGQIDRWPVIVVPEWEALAPATVSELVAYAKRGGSLLISGAKTCGLFKKRLGVEFMGEPSDVDAVIYTQGLMSRVKGAWQDVQPAQGKGGAKVLAWRTTGLMEKMDRKVAATITPLGKGRIAAVYGPFGLAHWQTHTPGGRELMREILGRLYRPIVRLGEGTPPVIDLAVRKQGARLVVHLNNVTAMPTSTGAGERYHFTDYIPPTPAIELRVHTNTRPARVTLAPQGTRVRHAWSGGELTLKVPPVHIHSAVVIE